MKNIVDLVLDVGYQVYVAYNRDLEGLLSTMSNNSKYEAMVRVQAPLIEK